jgi:hypothetical protein
MGVKQAREDHRRGRWAGFVFLGGVLYISGCGGSFNAAEYVPTVSPDETRAMLAHLRSIQACFAQAQPLAIDKQGFEVVPSQAPMGVQEAAHAPDGATFVLGSHEGISLYSDQGAHLGTLSIAELFPGGSTSLLSFLYSQDGGELLVSSDSIGGKAPSPGIVIDVRAAKLAGRCEVAPANGIAAPGATHGVISGVMVDAASGAATPLRGMLGGGGGVFSPDGSKLLVTNADGPTHAMRTVLTVYARNGKILARHATGRPLEDGVQAGAISNDAKTLVSTDPKAIHVLRDGREVRSFDIEGVIMGLSLAPRGDWLVGMLKQGPDDPKPSSLIAQASALFGVLTHVNVNSGVRRPFVSATLAGVSESQSGITLSGMEKAAWLAKDDLTKPLEWWPFAAPLPPPTQGKPEPSYSLDMSPQPIGKPGWRPPVLVARDEQSVERYRREIPSSYVMSLLHDERVVAFRVDGLYMLPPESLERVKAGELGYAQLPELGLENLMLLDAQSGEPRNIVPASDVVKWDSDELLTVRTEGASLCMQVISTRTFKPSGEPQCAELPWPAWVTALGDHATSLKKMLRKGMLAKHPSRKQVVVMDRLGAALLFDGKGFTTLWPASDHSGDTATAAVVSERRNEVFASYDGRVVACKLSDCKPRTIARLESPSKPVLAVKDTRLLVSGERSVSVFDAESGARLARWYVYEGDEWTLLGEDGTYAASANGAKFLSIRVAGKVSTLGQYAEKLYRPDVVYGRIQGGPIQDQPAVNIQALASRNPPALEWEGQASGVMKQRDVTLTAKIHVRDGGLGRIEWRLNGMVIGSAADKRGLTITKEQATVKRLMTLAPGMNRIEVVAYDAKNEVASPPIVAEFHLQDAISERPSLYLLAVGVNAYRDRALQLKYAVPDAEALAKSLQDAAGSVFERVQVTMLTDAGATRDGLRQAFEALAGKVKSHDVFVFYLAGHGITLDGRYHFVPVDFRWRNEESVRQDGVNHDNLRDWLATVPALKSLVLLDTCNSGSFTSQAMATRGLAEKTAIDKLTRATGRATIAASSENQVAIEGHKGHGVFTWVLMEAMRQADTNQDNVLTTTELASFVDERVPKLTYERWGYEQVPQIMMHGREFPIGVVPKGP